MVNHLIHGDILLDVLSNGTDKRVFFVKGEVEVEERKKIIDLMEMNDNIVCIAMSSIFSTGINIKNLPNILFVGLGKSFIRVVQSIGRGLRLHDNKNKLNIFDVMDNMKYSYSHALHRQSIYDKEEIPWKIKEVSL
jgi:superfamily II DNA or RNA helicase